MRGAGKQRQLWRPGNIGNQDFDLDEEGNKAIYFRGAVTP